MKTWAMCVLAAACVLAGTRGWAEDEKEGKDGETIVIIQDGTAAGVAVGAGAIQVLPVTGEGPNGKGKTDLEKALSATRALVGAPGTANWFPNMRGRGMGNYLQNMLHGALGVETPPKLDVLSYGAEKRLVLKVPVGGVDTLSDWEDGAKAEEVFTLTDEQTKSLETLRDEYKKELEKYQKQLDEVGAALATQVKDLRRKYELKANDVLAGEAKAAKEKLDALAADWAKQRETKAGESKAEVDGLLADFEKLQAESRAKANANPVPDKVEAYQKLSARASELAGLVRDSRSEVTKQSVEKMKEAVSGDAKERLSALFQKQERRFDQGRPLNRRGRGPGGKDEAKNPAEEQKAKDEKF